MEKEVSPLPFWALETVPSGERNSSRKEKGGNMEIVFTRERETKRTIRFQEVSTNPVVGALYVQKWAMEQLGNPQKIIVKIEKA